MKSGWKFRANRCVTVHFKALSSVVDIFVDQATCSMIEMKVTFSIEALYLINNLFDIIVRKK
jgi:hypothetical protein